MSKVLRENYKRVFSIPKTTQPNFETASELTDRNIDISEITEAIDDIGSISAARPASIAAILFNQ